MMQPDRNNVTPHPCVVAAVMVTYEPDLERVRQNIISIRAQVDKLVVIDNGSAANAAASLKSYVDPGNTYIHLPNNFGIARAQNIGIDWARKQSASYVLLLDQDSMPAPDLVMRLMEVAEKEAMAGELVGLIAPSYIDSRWEDVKPFSRFRGGNAEWVACEPHDKLLDIDSAISSGSLIPISALNAVGGMLEELFIDLVDVEWCFRARKLGYRLIGVCDAVIVHSLGESPRTLAGRKVTIHSPLRTYYFYRNAVWLFRQQHVPSAWKRAIRTQMLKRLVVFPLFVPPRLTYFEMMTLGICHGLTGRLGRFGCHDRKTAE